MALGAIVTTAAFVTAQRNDDRRVEAELGSLALLRAAAFERRLATAMDSLKAMAFFIAGEPELDAAKFQRFARRDHDADDVNSALIWAPLVRDSDRRSLVAAQVVAGIHDFEIREPAGDGELVVAGQRDAYLPAMFEQAYAGTPNRAGIDMLSLPERRIRAERARDEGQPIATPPVVVFPRGERQLGFVVFWPIYASADLPATPEARRAAYRGAAVSRIEVARLLPALIASSPDVDESIEFLVDRGRDGGPPQRIGTYDAGSGRTTVGDSPVAAAAGGSMAVRTFASSGRQWTIRFHFPAAMVASRRSDGPWAWLVLGLCLTGLAAVLLHRERGRRAADLRRWGDAFRNAAFGIAIGDAKTNTVQSVNPALAAMMGRSVAEAEGIAIGELYADSERAAVLAQMAVADRTGNAVFATLQRRKDGTTYPAEINVTSVRDADGTVRYRIVSVLDVTNAQRTEAALRQSQKMEAIGNLTGGMAHDFNNLLGIIIGNLDLIRRGNKADPDTRELVDESFDAAWRGADLTRRLLAFARRQPLEPRRIELNASIEGLVTLLRRLLGENVEISLDLASDLWPVIADPAQLEASITNLATNARDAMPNGGRLMIATANRHLDAAYAAEHSEVSPGDYAVIEVSDTGTGMTPEVLSKVFEPFYTTKELGKGTGLGLSMVFGFMKQSGGHVSVYSQRGSGTTFRLFLPRSLDGAIAEVAPVPESSPLGKGETILVVEDNLALRQVVVRQLRSLGYRPIEAENAARALAILQGVPVDLLFTDIVMPGPLDGAALARRVLASWPRTKVVLTSGFAESKIAASLGRSSSLRLLSKPYGFDDLARLLRSALDGTGAGRSAETPVTDSEP